MKYNELLVEGLHHPWHLSPPLGRTHTFQNVFWHQETRVPKLLFGVGCVMINLASLIELRLIMDRQTGITHRQREGHSINSDSTASCVKFS